MTSATSRRFVIEEADQVRRLQLCGIDPSLYAGLVDPSAYTALAIQEAARTYAALPTGVHAGQRLTISRLPRLDEELDLVLSVAEPQKVDRGDLIRFSASLNDELGGTWVDTAEDFVVLDPAASSRGKPLPQAEEAAAVVSKVGAVAFDPPEVVAYCGMDVNPIHFDPEAAAAAGFRAPIIGGEQGVRHAMQLIWRTLRPVALDISLRFLRPLFWDDRCDLMVDSIDGRWTSVSLAKDGKKAIEVTIHA